MNPYVLKFFTQSCNWKNGLFSSLIQCSARGGRMKKGLKELPKTSRGGSQRSCAQRTEGLIFSGEDEHTNSNPNTGFAPLCSPKGLPQDLLQCPGATPAGGLRGAGLTPPSCTSGPFQRAQKTSARLFVSASTSLHSLGQAGQGRRGGKH